MAQLVLQSPRLTLRPARPEEKLGFVVAGPCRLKFNSRGADQAGMQTLLTRDAFEARFQ